jgi:hypothetical protein
MERERGEQKFNQNGEQKILKIFFLAFFLGCVLYRLLGIWLERGGWGSILVGDGGWRRG